MNSLKILVAMQLKDKIDFSAFKNWKTALFKSIWTVVKFLVITAGLYIAFSVLSMLRLIDLSAGIPDKFLLVIFTLMMFLSILGATIGLVKSLYYAKDNQLLLTMPTSRVNIFFSKLIVYFLYECIRNITFILPLFIAYGIVNGYGFLYFLWLFPSILVLTGVTISVSALLSIPAMFISNFFRNFKVLQYIVIVLLVGLGIYALVTIINLIPADLNIVETWGTIFWEIQTFLDRFGQIFIPFAYLMEMIVGIRYGVSHTMFHLNQWLCFLGAIGTIVVLLGICYLVVRPLFYKIASSPFEYKKNNNVKPKKNHKRNSFISAVLKETKVIFRTPEKFYTLIGLAIGMPIAILLLNRIYNAMDTRLIGTYMTVIFNLLMIMLLALSSNTLMAKTYSEEGASSYLIKTNPESYFTSLVAKLVPNAIISTISIIVTCIIYGKFGGNFVNVPLLIIAVESFYLAHLLWSAELDFMNPQNAQYASTGTHTNNPNEIKSTLYMFLIAIVVAIATKLILPEGVLTFYLKFMIIGLGLLALRLYLYIMKIKVYYREK